MGPPPPPHLGKLGQVVWGLSFPLLSSPGHLILQINPDRDLLAHCVAPSYLVSNGKNRDPCKILHIPSFTQFKRPMLYTLTFISMAKNIFSPVFTASSKHRVDAFIVYFRTEPINKCNNKCFFSLSFLLYHLGAKLNHKMTRTNNWLATHLTAKTATSI